MFVVVVFLQLILIVIGVFLFVFAENGVFGSDLNIIFSLISENSSTPLLVKDKRIKTNNSNNKNARVISCVTTVYLSKNI